MHRTFLSLAVAALAGFATAVHADDSAASRSTVVSSRGRVADLVRAPQGQMIVAELHGKGEIGKACHATFGSTDLYRGTYKLDSGELICEGAGTKVYCHPEQRPNNYDSNRTHCYDGYKS